MRKLLLAAIGLLTAFALPALAPDHDNKKNAPEPPDLQKIREEVNNPGSRYYYPELMKRYEVYDTTRLTLDDYRHLYLGAMYQEDYNPYRKSEYRDRIQELYYRPDHSRTELDSIIAYAELSLADDPFDLEQMNYLIYALKGRGKINKAAIWQFRLNHLLQAIVSTGTGLDPENAWYVINPRHEYNIVNFQNRVVEGQEFKEPHFEYIRLVPPDDQSAKTGGVEGYYFNIRPLLEEYYRKYPEQL
ncbi:MAG: DUF4919 domain-containing protein [Muribaculaceae bacterium]|nr:DUF4919 domain-containing protein [Muribaculaceae bacterium]MDE6645319.1 DUF4919 domain-containing protein [Muribaculaceae bacterium]